MESGTLKAITAIIGTCSLVLLGYYMLLFHQRRLSRLHSIRFNTHPIPGSRLPIWVAAFGLWMCLNQGAYEMLFWIPQEWGFGEMDGTYKSVRGQLSIIFSLVITLLLITYLQQSIVVHSELYLSKVSEQGKTKISEATGNITALKALQEEFENKEAELLSSRPRTHDLDAEEARIYRQLLRHINEDAEAPHQHS